MNIKRTDNFKRGLLKFLSASPFAGLLNASAAESKVSRIAFGSCAHQDKPQPIWNAIVAEQPDAFIFLGDNIYGDSDDPEVLKAKYQKLASKPGFQQLKAQVPVFATWDDHDYGQNDSGHEYVSKEESRKIMLEFWNEPKDSDRWHRPDGIYTSEIIEADDKKIQIILLDLRWNRTELETVSNLSELGERNRNNQGPYNPGADPQSTLMGEAQWLWLEEQMQLEADFRIIGSSIQLLADFTGWETWLNFPDERERFIELMKSNQQCPAIIISGDVHWCELSRMNVEGMSQPLLELTSSGLTEIWEQISPNKHRVGEAFAVENFGLIEIDWSGQTPSVSLFVKGVEGNTLIEYHSI